MTKEGTDPLLSAEENCSDPIGPPNELEVSHAFTRRMSHLLCVMRAISNFKSLLSSRSRHSSPRLTLSPLDADPSSIRNLNNGFTPIWPRHKPKPSMDEQELEALKRDNEEHAARLLEERKRVLGQRGDTTDRPDAPAAATAGDDDDDDSRDRAPPLHSAPLLLGIGPGGPDSLAGPGDEQPCMVAESPTAADFNVYDRAYEEEVERIRRDGGADKPSVYMTRHLGPSRDRVRADEGMDVREGGEEDVAAAAVQKPIRFADLVAQAIRDTKARALDGEGGEMAQVEEKGEEDTPEAIAEETAAET